MIPSYLSFNVLYFVIVVLNHLLFEVESFTPLGRLAHTSVLVENKLYFLGGVINDPLKASNGLFYLDVSKQFDVSTPPWVDPTITIPFGSSYATVAMRNINNKPTIYLIGGFNAPLLSTLDLNTSKWSKPFFKDEPLTRSGMKSVIDDTGKIYIYGGIHYSSPTYGIQYLDEMLILDTVGLSWSDGFTMNSPKDRFDFTATFLPNGIIVYIGGIIVAISGNKEVDIGEIKLYNTNLSIWTTELIFCKAPDGKVIVYGGVKSVGEIRQQVVPDLAVLNTNIKPFEWTVPSVSSGVKVPSLAYHTANLVGDYMIVAFGNITQKNSGPLENKNPNIYVMDIKSYTWVNTLNPPKLGSSSSSTTGSTSSSTTSKPGPMTIAGTTGGIATLIIIISVSYLLYRKKRTIIYAPQAKHAINC
ncbi:galactose oxidase [Rhizophagus irregularis]|uniref:Galactose oxidase n=1 Tax=Rhizophagus irregularis TaxID=588596 RepID=A0A2I1FV01_9GLOM|nr:galactose oxidase [Rhizophagus irregularis]